MDVTDWLQAFQKEALLSRNKFPPFDTLYLGGGTPSLLSAGELGTLLETVRREFLFTSLPEITLEANPDDATMERFMAWHALGINRISLGVQATENEHLTFLGRRHTVGQTFKAMETIKNSGFCDLCIDLIYGLPGHEEGAWVKSLEQILAFQPDHISCYQLTPAEDTPLGRQKARGRLTMPDEEEERRLFLAASRFLEDRDYFHYEVSNFAKEKEGSVTKHESPLQKDPFEASSVCRHNLKYWTRAPYLGLGPSAHSFQENVRWWNARSIESYREALDSGLQPLEGRETLTKDQERLERLSLLLRTRKGVGREDLDSFPNTEEVLPRLLREGYLEILSDRVVPTKKGFLVADGLPLLFL